VQPKQTCRPNETNKQTEYKNQLAQSPKSIKAVRYKPDKLRRGEYLHHCTSLFKYFFLAPPASNFKTCLFVWPTAHYSTIYPSPAASCQVNQHESDVYLFVITPFEPTFVFLASFSCSSYFSKFLSFHYFNISLFLLLFLFS